MSLLDALAAALRDRLLADGSAAVPGHGTLRRQRAAARVEEQPDGSRLLLPPSETVVFAPGPAAADAALASAIGLQLGRADGRAALQEATDQLDGLLSATGTSALPGVGTLRRTGAGVAFEVDPSLLAAVGQPYDGLAPVSTASTSPSDAAPPPADTVFIDEDTLDDDLDDVLDDDGVLAVPFDASGTIGLSAILPTTDPERDPSVDSPPSTGNPDAPTESPTASAPPAGGRSPIPRTRAERLDGAVAATPTESATPVEPAETIPPPPVPAEPEAPAADADAPDAPPPDADLGWLDAYESEAPPPVEATTTVASAAPADPAPARVAAPISAAPPAPTAEPVHDEPSRSGVWLWAFVPLVALVAAFFWFRATQTTEPAEPARTAEPSARLASEPPPADSLTAAAALAAADSAAGSATGVDSLAGSTAATPSGTGPTAAAPLADGATSAPDSAALAGEFPVREMSGAGRGAVSPATPAAASSAPRATRSAPARPSPIDRPPDLSELPEADREALVGTAPIVVGRGGFTWVVLSTREREPADRRAKLFREAGWRVRVLQTEALGDVVYRVALGQFDSREQADRLRPLLPSQVPADTWRLDLSTL